MSNIDEKLREVEIPTGLTVQPNENFQEHIKVKLTDEAIAQIKQAFQGEYELIPRSKDEANDN